MKLYTRVTDCDIPHHAQMELLKAFAAHNDKDILITIERKRKIRSLNQNNFFHGPFVESALNMFLDRGNDFGEKMVKEIIKDLFGPKFLVTMPDGRQEFKAKSSADWTTAEAEDVMEKARAWAAHYGYQLAVPNEIGE